MGQVTGNPEWKDYPDESTPVTAQALNKIEKQLDQKSYSQVKTINTSMTLTDEEPGSLIVYDSNVAGTITLPDATGPVLIPIGSWVDFTAIGSGLITIIAPSGVSILTTKTPILSTTNAVASLIRVASDKWMVVGELAGGTRADLIGPKGDMGPMGPMGVTYFPSGMEIVGGEKNNNSSAELSMSQPRGNFVTVGNKSISGIDLYVGTVAAGSTVTACIYDSDANGLPTGQPLAQTMIDTSTTGFKAVLHDMVVTGPNVWAFFTTSDTSVRLGGRTNNSNGLNVPYWTGNGGREAQRSFYIDGFTENPVLKCDASWRKQPTFLVRY